MSPASIQSSTGAHAVFSAHGELLRFTSRTVSWYFNGPQPACALILSGPETKRTRWTPTPNSGRITAARPDSISVRFPVFTNGTGDVLKVPVEITWMLTDDLLQGNALIFAPESPFPDDTALHALVFPDLAAPVSIDGELILPRLEGLRVHDAGKRLARRESTGFRLRYPGQMSMQFLAWSEPGRRGLYLDTRDEQGWSREFHVAKSASGDSSDHADAPDRDAVKKVRVRFQVHHILPRFPHFPSDGFRFPYPVTISGFDGSWFEAARIYRRWAATTRFAQRGPEQRRNNWIAEIACWVWNRGRADHVCPPVLELARRIGLPVALDWYWWHKHGYDTEYPDYFPPREGEETLRNAIRNLHEYGVYTQIYTNGIGYDMQGGLWEPDGPKCAIVLEDGGIRSQVFNVYTGRPLAYCCGGSDLWLEKIRSFVREARRLGIHGLYIDMISNVAGAYPCFNPTHGHLPGGGYYQVEGFRRLWRELRTEHPGFPFTTEAPAEVFADLVDGFITINTSNERLGNPYDPLNLWNAVYHGRAVCFGNYAIPDGVPPYDDLWPPEHRPRSENEKNWHALCPDQFAIEIARGVVAGVQPMVANLRMSILEDPEFEEDIAFLVHIARFYHRHREWLLWGDMEAPGRLSCHRPVVRFLQRFIFTPAGKEKILEKEQPAVLHSVWRAPDGKRRLFLVNYTRIAQPIRYEPAPAVRREPDGPFSLHRTCPDLLHPAPSDAGGFTATIPPRTCVSVPLP